MLKPKILLLFLLATIAVMCSSSSNKQVDEEAFVYYVADPQKQKIELYWKDDSGNILGSIGNLKKFVEAKGKKLIFAANGGMYQEDRRPLGLFIQNYELKKRLNQASSAEGNFYLKPNGIFYITGKNEAFVTQTSDFKINNDIKYATQSGPMLLVDGKIHAAFMQNSQNLNIRNGVGILPGGNILFAMSKQPVNFYDFALFFKNMGCKNALYFDGTVSRTYLPEKNWLQTDGHFGVMVGVTDK